MDKGIAGCIFFVLLGCITGGEEMEEQPGMPAQRVTIDNQAPPPKVSVADRGPLNVGQLMDFMAIDVKPGQRWRFVVGDNVRGYFEGWTSTFKRGAGYVLGEGAVFMGFGTGIGGRLLNRAGPEANQRVLPFGFLSSYPGGTEELAFHRFEQGLSIRVRSSIPEKLCIIPLLNLDLANIEVRADTGVLLIGPGDDGPANEDPAYLALSLDRSGFISTDIGDVPPEMAYDLSLTPQSGFVVAGSNGQETELTLNLCFGKTAEEARNRALERARSDAVGMVVNEWYETLTRSILWTDDAQFNRALLWAKAASWSFYVDEFGKGLWAGLPWFRDNWGRDTFIALPGTFLVTGHFHDSRLVIENFLQYQNKGRVEGAHNTDKDLGRIPNRVNRREIIYNTVDGTPLLLKALREYVGYSGDVDFAVKTLPAIRLYLESSLQFWVDEDGLLTHDDADTWMDARISGRQPWSPRGNRSIEIQALWYQALRTAGDVETWAGNPNEARRWYAFSEKVRASIERLFWNGRELADRLRRDGTQDFKPRPNAFIAISYPLDPLWISPRIQHAVIRQLVPQLVYPYGVASLGIEHPYFHPRHEYPGRYHKDAAYHNGALWGWLAGPVISTLARWGRQDFAYRLTENLAGQMLEQGALGTLSENSNAEPGPDGLPVLTGTYSQSWSVAEFARVAYQDYLGLMPDLARDTLTLAPRLPTRWKSLKASLQLGSGFLELTLERTTSEERWSFQTRGLKALQLKFQPLDTSGRWVNADLNLPAEAKLELVWNGTVLRVGNRTAATTVIQPPPTLGELNFVSPPNDWGNFPVLQDTDVLKKIVLEGEYR